MRVHVQITCVINVAGIGLPEHIEDGEVIFHGVSKLNALSVCHGASVIITPVNAVPELTKNQRRIQLNRRKTATRRR